MSHGPSLHRPVVVCRQFVYVRRCVLGLSMHCHGCRLAGGKVGSYSQFLPGLTVVRETQAGQVGWGTRVVARECSQGSHEGVQVLRGRP